MKALKSAAVASALTVLSVSAADWANWRGPDGLGVSPDRGFPMAWSKTNHVAWSRELPGKGASSPITFGDRLYVTTQTPDLGLHLLALDRRTGATVWDTQVGQGKARAHQLHNMATPTAVTDGESIWVQFGTGDFACVKADGKIRWQRQIAKEYGTYNANHGYGSSPMLFEGRVYVPWMHQGPSFLLALDGRTGRNVWKQDRNFEAREEGKDSYSSAIFVRTGQRTDLVIEGAEAMTGYDPASGKQRWIVKGLEAAHPYGRTIAGITAGEGLIVAVTSGFQNRGQTVAYRVGGEGDLTQSHRAWAFSKFSPDCPTPVIHQGLLFTIRDDGMASCVDLKTGEAHWQERLFTENVKVSPVAADGRIYFTSGQANCVVVKAAAKFEVLARNEWNEETLSTPALSDGRIYLRTFQGLTCLANP